MKRFRKMSLGIDISQTQVSMALVGRSPEGNRLLQGIQVPLPQGVIVDGRVQDGDVLLGVLSRLRKELRVDVPGSLAWAGGSAVHQVIELPHRVPGNVADFVQGELKQCVAVSGEHMVCDYAGLSEGSNTSPKLLAVAADERQVSQLIRICTKSRWRVEAVEPAILSLTRAMMPQWIPNSADTQTMILWLRDNTLQLAVLKKGYLDFLHTRSLNTPLDPHHGLAPLLVQEVKATVQYYAMEVLEDPRAWQVHVVLPSSLVPAETVREAFATDFAQSHIELDVCEEDAFHIDGADTGLTSAVAVGLARRALEETDKTPVINLLPQRILQARTLHTQLKWASVVAGLSVAFMALLVWGLAGLADRSRQGMKRYRAQHNINETVSLVEQRAHLEAQIETFSQSTTLVSKLVETRTQVDWATVLDDIHNQSQANLQITRVEKDRDDSGLIIQGVSPTFGDVNAFRKGLTASKHILDAEVIQAEYVELAQGRFVQYQLLCEVMDHSGRTPCLPIASFN